jgi:uncharacterized protein YraI
MKGCLKIGGYIFLGFFVLSIIGVLLRDKNDNIQQFRAVNTQVLNVRKGPGADYNKIGEKEKGQKLAVLKDTSGWLKVKNNDTVAWVKKEYTVENEKWKTINTEKNEENTASKSTNSSIQPISYEIMKTKDLSSKNYGRLNSEYGISERPVKHKIQYHIALGLDANREQIKPTAKTIVQDISNKNPDIDEIILELYSEKELAEVGGAGDIAKAIWAANGELGNVTPEIARSNNRNSYNLKIDFRQENLAKYLKQKKKTEKKFGLTEAKRKEIYKALVKAGDKAIKEADRKFEVGTSKHSKATKKLREKYKRMVYQKYDITKEVAKKINNEALKENWASPEF